MHFRYIGKVAHCVKIVFFYNGKDSKQLFHMLVLKILSLVDLYFCH